MTKIIPQFLGVQYHFLPSTPISLEEAYKISEKSASKWNSRSELLLITSADNSENKDLEGADAKRRFWNAIFAVPNESKELAIVIHDGKIFQKLETSDMNPEESLIDFSRIKISSKNALEEAKSIFHLQPSTGWAKGYNFTLGKSGENVILSIVGQDISGYFAKINFDAISNEIFNGEYKKPFGGELFKDNKQLTILPDSWVVKAYLSPNYKNYFTIVTSQFVIIWREAEN